MGCHSDDRFGSVSRELGMFEHSFNSDFHKVFKAISNELGVVDYLELIANKNLFSANVGLETLILKSSIVLDAARE
jgi:hypothetical protein